MNRLTFLLGMLKANPKMLLFVLKGLVKYLEDDPKAEAWLIEQIAKGGFFTQPPATPSRAVRAARPRVLKHGRRWSVPKAGAPGRRDGAR